MNCSKEVTTITEGALEEGIEKDRQCYIKSVFNVSRKGGVGWDGVRCGIGSGRIVSGVGYSTIIINLPNFNRSSKLHCGLLPKDYFFKFSHQKSWQVIWLWKKYKANAETTRNSKKLSDFQDKGISTDFPKQQPPLPPLPLVSEIWKWSIMIHLCERVIITIIQKSSGKTCQLKLSKKMSKKNPRRIHYCS